MLSNQSQDRTPVFNTTIFWDIDGTLFRARLSNETRQAFNNVPLEELLRDNAQGQRLKALMQQINNNLCASRLNNFHACLTAKNNADAYTDYLAEEFKDIFYTKNPAKNKKIKTAVHEDNAQYYITKQLQTIRTRSLIRPNNKTIETNTHFITPFIIANNLCADTRSEATTFMKKNYPAIYMDNMQWKHAQNRLSGLLKVCEMEAYCHKTGTHPNCLILVDDAVEVVQAAQKYGFIAIHFPSTKSFDQMETELLAAVEQVKINALKNKNSPYSNPDNEKPPELTKGVVTNLQISLLKTIADDILDTFKASTNSSNFYHAAATGLSNTAVRHNQAKMQESYTWF